MFHVIFQHCPKDDQVRLKIAMEATAKILGGEDVDPCYFDLLVELTNVQPQARTIQSLQWLNLGDKLTASVALHVEFFDALLKSLSKTDCEALARDRIVRNYACTRNELAQWTML